MTITQHFKALGTLVHAVYAIDKIYEDGKLDWDDTPTIMTFIGGQALVWGGDLLDWRKVGKKPLYIIEAAILVGGVVSYAIGGREGLVTYTDVLTGKVGPGEWYRVVEPAVKGKFLEHIFIPLLGEMQEKEREMSLLGGLMWHVIERQLKRTGFDPKYPYII